MHLQKQRRGGEGLRVINAGKMNLGGAVKGGQKTK